MLHIVLLALQLAVCVSSSARTWTSHTYARFDGLSAAELSARFLGVLPDNAEVASVQHVFRPTALVNDSNAVSLPSAFDWRDVFLSFCIGTVPDQGECGSCWAVASVESLSDRRCIREAAAAAHSHGPQPQRIALSSLDVVACDKLCEGLEKCCRGCAGGYPKLAFDYIKEKGIVTDACMPYNTSRSLLCPLPECRSPISDAKYKARDVKQVIGGALAMRAELVASGPGECSFMYRYILRESCSQFDSLPLTSLTIPLDQVAATFSVYEDFMQYRSGVYQLSNSSGKRLGLHAVKVVGYGVLNVSEEGKTRQLQYWKCQNSWGSAWGMNGSFMIAQGACGFEESVFTATPCIEGEICV